MNPLIATVLVVVFAFLFLMSLRLGVTGAGLFLIACLAGFIIYRLGFQAGKDEKGPDRIEDGSTPRDLRDDRFDGPDDFDQGPFG